MSKIVTHEEFCTRVNNLNPNIKILGTYINAKTKIECKCLIDNHIWSVLPGGLLQGNGCPKCTGNNKKTHKVFCEEMYDINQNIEILGVYKNNKTKILCKCKIDNHEWQALPTNLLKNHGCPKCSAKKTGDNFRFLMRNLKIN